jgi:hypothetical protein
VSVCREKRGEDNFSCLNKHLNKFLLFSAAASCCCHRGIRQLVEKWNIKKEMK